MSTHETTSLKRTEYDVHVATWDEPTNGILMIYSGSATLIADVTQEQAAMLAKQFAALAERLERERVAA
jgi:hypothetical protein